MGCYEPKSRLICHIDGFVRRTTRQPSLKLLLLLLSMVAVPLAVLLSVPAVVVLGIGLHPAKFDSLLNKSVLGRPYFKFAAHCAAYICFIALAVFCASEQPAPDSPVSTAEVCLYAWLLDLLASRRHVPRLVLDIVTSHDPFQVRGLDPTFTAPNCCGSHTLL